jgi:hypothetical protein
MTVSDVFVAAPWIVFGTALGVVYILLLRSRRGSGRRLRRSGTPAADPDGPVGLDGPAQAATRAHADRRRPAAAAGWKQNAPPETETCRR